MRVVSGVFDNCEGGAGYLGCGPGENLDVFVIEFACDPEGGDFEVGKKRR